MRVVFLTQVIDADHPALAQTIDMVRALAARCERVQVMCDHVGRHDLPANVSLDSFGASSKVMRGLRFERALSSALAMREPPDAVLSHMIPVFLILAAPLARLRRVPLLLWYTHWHASRSLRIATRLATRVVSVDATSFPLRSPKILATGHAIDVRAFAPRGHRAPPGGSLRLLSLGRTAPWKGYRTLLTGFERASREGLDATLEIRGPSLTEPERVHRAELERLIGSSAVLVSRVRIEPPVPRDILPELLSGADAVVSAVEPDGPDTLDKVVYEAAACEVPVLTSNASLDAFSSGLPLRLRFRARDADDLASALLEFAASTTEARLACGRALRERVVEGHSVESWADQIVAAVSDAAPHRRS